MHPSGSISDCFHAWEDFLGNDKDRSFLLNGIQNGFDVVQTKGIPVSVEQNNYKSTTENFVLVEKQISQEICEGRYKLVTEKPLLISALGAIPKPNGDLRLIHDCSRPPDLAVNDYVQEQEQFSYQTVKDATNLIEQGYYMCKVDLKSAYRSVKVNPSNYKFLGLKWCFNDSLKPTYMVDTRLPFGSKLAPGIFNRLSQAIRRRMQVIYNIHLVAYLDDFVIAAPNFEQCQSQMLTLINVLRKLGFSISWQKLISPTQFITFLGIQIDSRAMTLSLPEDKISNILNLLQNMMLQKRAAKRQLESLAGKLVFAGQIVQGGRIYLRRMLTFICKLKRPHHKAKLTSDFLKDLHWWILCIRSFNCKNILPIYTKTHIVRTDACNIGAGFIFNSDWGYVHWEGDFPKAASLHINHKEILAISLAIKRWAPLFAGGNIIVCTDSTVARDTIKKGTSRHPLVMEALREVFWLSAFYNFSIEASHVPGITNDGPDVISRLHIAKCQYLFDNICLKYSLIVQPWWFHMSKFSFSFLSQASK